MKFNFSFLWKFVGGTVILILFLISIFVALRDKEKGPSQTSDQKILEDSIEVSAISGTLLTKDFTKEIVRDTTNSIVLAETSEYLINYFKKDKAFTILLLSKPLKEARQKAGVVLKEKLGIPEDQICRLKLSVGVTFDVSDEFAGRDLGLDFCLSSEEL